MKYITLYLVPSVNGSALLPEQWFSKLEVVSSAVWHRSRWRGGRSSCLTVQSSLAVLGAAMPCPSSDTRVRKPGQLRFTAEKPKCSSWPLLIYSLYSSPVTTPHFLPSVIHPLINLLACHVVSTCQMMITKKPGQLWSTAKVQEELCRTTFLQKAMSDTVWEVHSLIHSFSHFCIFYLFPIVLNKLCNWCYCTNQLFLSADNTSNVD